VILVLYLAGLIVVVLAVLYECYGGGFGVCESLMLFGCGVMLLSEAISAMRRRKGKE
jgi:hypothetical protein